jgi:hypothetical protein
VRLTGAVPVGATCAWTFEDGDPPRQSTLDCAEPINLRVRYGRPTPVTVDVSSGPDAPQRVTTQIAVRDVFIAGLGDSIASGEGNPDKPVALSDDGFCFRSYLGGPAGMYFRPGRAGFSGCPRLRHIRRFKPAELATRRRAMDEPGVPPLALQLPDPYGDCAGGAKSADRGNLPAAGLHRRNH